MPTNTSAISIRQSNFILLEEKQAKTFSVQWTDTFNRPMDITKLKVFKTDKDYNNPVEITNPDVAPNSVPSQNLIGFSFVFQAPSSAAQDLFYQFEYTMPGKVTDMIIIRINSYNKPTGNPATQGDVMIFPKP
jgi:hypothetical protein